MHGYELFKAMNSKERETMFLEFVNKKNYAAAKNIAPLIEKRIVDQMVIEQCERGNYIGDLYAFADSGVRDSVIVKLYSKFGLEFSSQYLPFVTKDAAEEIARIEYQENGLLNFKIIAPFITRKLLNKYVEKDLVNYENKIVQLMFPFWGNKYGNDLSDCLSEDSTRDEAYLNIRNARSDYEFLLKKYSQYSYDSMQKVEFIYHSRLDDNHLNDLFTVFKLGRFLNSTCELDVFEKVLRWSHEVILYDAQAKYVGHENAVDIVRFCQNNKVTVNCRLHAIILTEALLSLGFPARLVCCMPIDVLPYDNHAMTAVYSKEMEKWVLLDASRNCYFKNKNGLPLSPIEVRSHLIKNIPFDIVYLHRFSKLKRSNRLIQLDDDWYLDYLYKNMFRFYCSSENGTTYLNKGLYYHLVPSGYAPIVNEQVIVYSNETQRIIQNTDSERIFWAKPNV